MNPKKWTTYTLAVLVGLLSFLIFSVNFVIDPYGEFRFVESVFNRFKFEAHMTTALQVASKLTNSKYSLIFGSSRTMLISEHLLGEPVLNFSTSIYRNPGNVFAFLEMLNDQQVKNIKHIYMLIDINGFGYTNIAPEMVSRNKLRLAAFENISPKKCLDALDCMRRNICSSSQPKDNYIDEFGVLHALAHKFEDKSITFKSECSNYYITKLLSVKHYCSTYNIPVTFFTVPWFRSLPEKLQIDLNKILNEIKSKSIPLVDLQFCNELYGKENFFLDSSHMNAAGLNIFIQKLKSSTPSVELSCSGMQNEYDLSQMTYNEFYDLMWRNQIQGPQIVSKAIANGRDDLFLKFYDGLSNQNKKIFIQNGFRLSKIGILKLLLETKRLFLTDQDIMDNALEGAILSGNSNLVRNAILLGANVNFINEYGESALLSALNYSPTSTIVQYLLNCGANPNYINTHLGSAYFNDSPYTLALKKGKDVFELLASITPDSPIKHYSQLVLKLSQHPESFTELQKLIKLHHEYYASGNWALARIQPLKIPDSAFKKIKGGYLLTLQGSRYLLSSVEMYFLKNLSAKEYLRNTVRRYLQSYSKKEPSEKVKKDVVTRLMTLISVLDKYGLVRIVR